MELAAKGPQLSNWFWRHGLAHVAQFDLGRDESDSFSGTSRTIPE